ncbi:Protein slit [Holothuria leucospilota]|uniref:Protein slit n=1 Tax=Holothuria leucospilota TaxID=206669 RepID=A0A9Q1HH92_HOLLE|nr:Protein slit [Holothuria leucospilota]
MRLVICWYHIAVFSTAVCACVNCVTALSCRIITNTSDMHVDCSSKRLCKIPLEIPRKVKRLNLSNNSITVVKEADLRGMTMLSTLDLSRNYISQIDPEAFEGLINVWDLNLSHNLLENLPKGLLDDLSQLYQLTLSHNRLTRIAVSLATHKSLIALNLAENNISSIDADFTKVEGANFSATRELLSLEHLDLGGNQLQTLPENLLYPLDLQKLNLSHNPWKCDCHLRWLSQWLAAHSFTKLGAYGAKCEYTGPHGGLFLQDIESHDLMCAPYSTAESLSYKISEGTPLEVICPVFADPRPNITWFVNGSQVLRNDDVKPAPLIPYLVTESQSLVFISPKYFGSIVTCRATNRAGTVFIPIFIEVLESNVSPPNCVSVRFGFDDPTELLALSCVLSTLVSVLALSMLIHAKICKYRKNRAQKSVYQTYRPPPTSNGHCYTLIRQGQHSYSITSRVHTNSVSDCGNASILSDVADTGSGFSDYDASGYLVVSASSE